ncbi:MAG TPA: hypothetical protein VIL88_02565 [Devosia sp.]|uniref:hypothetical protein n=1 Tax=Devosia sp. TaxID=1871048 RepID=UPI002F95B428
METIYVPGHVDGDYVGQKVVSEFRRMAVTGGVYLGNTALVRCTTAVKAAGVRPFDVVEEYLLSPEERAAGERRANSSARAIAIRRGEWKPGLGSYRCGEGEYERMSAPVGVWAVLKRLNDPWVRSTDTNSKARK